MLEVLDELLRALPVLLREREGWESLDVDYHPPRVERLYRPFGKYRAYLHLLHPCGPEEALFHPHPWPSAMKVLSGRYEMAVGYGGGESAPPVAARIIAEGALSYEMTDQDAWHSVRPLGEGALTVMVTGKPWERGAPRSPHPLVPLPEERVRELLARFRELLG